MNATPTGTWSTHVEDKDRSPFQVRYKIQHVRGRSVVTHLCVEPNPHLVADEPRPITTSDLAKIKPQDLIESDAAFMRALLDPQRRFVQRPTRYGDAEYAVIRDLLVRTAAADYDGPAARAVLQNLWGVSQSTADRLIGEARKRHPEAPRATRPGVKVTTKKEQS